MSMSKKDFEDIAQDLHIERNTVKHLHGGDGSPVLDGFDFAVNTLCGPFRRANDNFDWGRFMAWVEGGKPGKRK